METDNVIVFPVLHELNAERIGDPSRDARWAVTYDVEARILLGERTEELWALPRAQLNQLWDALVSGVDSRTDMYPDTCNVDGLLRVRSPLFGETDQRFLDEHDNPIGMTQKELDPEAAADTLYLALRSRKEWLAAPVDSLIDFGLLSKASGRPEAYFKEKYNLIRLVLPSIVFVGFSEIEYWEEEISELQEEKLSQQVNGSIQDWNREVSYEAFIDAIEEFFAQEEAAFTDKPSWLSLRVVKDSALLPGVGTVRVAELTSCFLRLRLYDEGARVRVVPVVPEPVGHRTITMTIANAQQMGAALMGYFQWNRNRFGRKTLILGGHEFHVYKG